MTNRKVCPKCKMNKSFDEFKPRPDGSISYCYPCEIGYYRTYNGVVYCRIAPATIADLDQICDSMRPKPTRAQLIDVALEDYVQRNRVPKTETRALK